MSGSAERHRFAAALQTLTHAVRHQPARLKREAKVEVEEMSSGSCASRTERQNKMGLRSKREPENKSGVFGS